MVSRSSSNTTIKGHLSAFIRTDAKGTIHSLAEADRHGVILRDAGGRVKAQGQSMQVDACGCVSIARPDGQFWSLDLVHNVNIERRLLPDEHGNWFAMTALFSSDGFRMATRFRKVKPEDLSVNQGREMASGTVANAIAEAVKTVGYDDSSDSGNYRFYGRDGSIIEFASDDELKQLRPTSVRPASSRKVDVDHRGKRQAGTAWEALQRVCFQLFDYVVRGEMTEAIHFGTDGWRAIIAEQFTFANVEKVSYAIGLYIKEAYGEAATSGELPVWIGYDTRFLADKFACRSAQVLAQMGLRVKLAARDIPTPAIAWAAQNEPSAGALQFTASHNPPEYCGVKYIPHYGGPATTAITGAITDNLGHCPPVVPYSSDQPESFDVSAPYMAAIKKLVDLDKIAASNLKVAYDALYSTSRGYLDKIIRECGLTLNVMHATRDPLFGGGMPEPKAKYLKELMHTGRRRPLRPRYCHRRRCRSLCRHRRPGLFYDPQSAAVPSHRPPLQKPRHARSRCAYRRHHSHARSYCRQVWSARNRNTGRL